MIDCPGSINGTFQFVDLLEVTGTSEAAPGTVLEIFLGDGQRKLVEVKNDGTFSAEFGSVQRNDSNKIVISLAKGSHYITSTEAS